MSRIETLKKGISEGEKRFFRRDRKREKALKRRIRIPGEVNTLKK